MYNFINDIYWKSALVEIFDVQNQVDMIFVPAEFLYYSNKFYPYEFSHLLDNEIKWAACIHKDMVHNLNTDLFRKSFSFLYENDVFCVIGNVNFIVGIRTKFFENSFRHKLIDRVFTQSTYVNQPWMRLNNSENIIHKALIIGANGIGNTGDNLIARRIADIILEQNPNTQVDMSDSNVSIQDLKKYNQVIIGGGGLIYATGHKGDQRQNLANYFKIPYMCQQLSIQCDVVSIGLQDNYTDIWDMKTIEFLTNSLNKCHSISCRDSKTRDFLQNNSKLKILFGSDICFSFGAISMDIEIKKERKIHFIGELFKENNEILLKLLSDTKQFESTFSGYELCFVMMSTDDIPHLELFTEELRKISWFNVSTIDARNFTDLQMKEMLSSSSLVLSNRFHGVIFSILSRAPTISISKQEIKHILLKNDFLNNLQIINLDLTREEMYKIIEDALNFPEKYICHQNEIDHIVKNTDIYRKQLVRQFKS